MRAIAPRPRIGTGYEAPRGPAPVAAGSQPSVDLTPITDRLAAAEASLATLHVERAKQGEAIEKLSRDLEEVKQPKDAKPVEVFR